jgi:acetyl/propionyl-CoA carboxylase alpha subunit
VLLPTNQSYTDGEEIIRIAKERNCDAIIPGYGFLSENAAFAKQVADAGMVWVG